MTTHTYLNLTLLALHHNYCTRELLKICAQEIAYDSEKNQVILSSEFSKRLNLNLLSGK